MMMAMKVRVAFQTIPVTVTTSAVETTPARSASAAPNMADQPMESPRGCQITRVSVRRNMLTASSTDTMLLIVGC